MLYRLMFYPLFLLLLIAIEGMCSGGGAYIFANYDVVAWIAQISAVILTIGLAEYACRELFD